MILAVMVCLFFSNQIFSSDVAWVRCKQSESDQDSTWESQNGLLKFKINSVVPSINNSYRYQYQSKPVSCASNKYQVSAANMHSVASVVQSFFSESWQDDTNYFANKFKNHDSAIAFRRFYHY
jgi:hypothetical protein